MIHYAEPRYTKDLDLWVEPSLQNAQRLHRCLAAFGAPIDNISVEDLATPGTLYVFGLPPNRVDILNRVLGATFGSAYGRKNLVSLAPRVRVPVVSLGDLIAIKRATARPHDLIDLEKLVQVAKRSRRNSKRVRKKR